MRGLSDAVCSYRRSGTAGQHFFQDGPCPGRLNLNGIGQNKAFYSRRDDPRFSAVRRVFSSQAARAIGQVTPRRPSRVRKSLKEEGHDLSGFISIFRRAALRWKRRWRRIRGGA